MPTTRETICYTIIYHVNANMKNSTKAKYVLLKEDTSKDKEAIQDECVVSHGMFSTVRERF